MAEVPLIGQNKPEPKMEEAQSVRAAFMIYLTNDGQYILEPDINAPIQPERQPTMDEIVAACNIVIKDMQIRETLENIPNVLLQFNMAMQQRAQEAQLQQEVMRTMKK